MVPGVYCIGDAHGKMMLAFKNICGGACRCCWNSIPFPSMISSSKQFQCFLTILVISQFIHNAVSTTNHRVASFVPSRDSHNVASSNSPSSNIRRAFTLLAAGRERRASSPDGSISAEEKLPSAEESARRLRSGQIKQRLQKAASRENRISALESKMENAALSVSKAERAELNGLLRVRESFEEQYDPTAFTKEHLEFKAMHNDAFVQLSRYCERERNKSNRSKVEGENGSVSEDELRSRDESANVFFLDGPEGGTASALINGGGFEAGRCYVANRHESSCGSLRVSGGGLLPDENVAHGTASEGLTIARPLGGGEDDAPRSEGDGAFARVDFAAYYFDGCGGFVPHVVGMMSAALLRPDCDPSKPVAVGYSLLGGGRDVVEKELAVSRALTIIARGRGMRVAHALDDPSRYGISPDVRKVGGSGGGGTFTTWLILQPDESR